MPVLIRVFISSPGDVDTERRIADQTLDRLQAEFLGRAELRKILWERQPLSATAGFQEQIADPADTDVFVCVLWSRLGTRLPGGGVGAGRTGTEYEFEQAFAAYREARRPEILVYRKSAPPLAPLTTEEEVARRWREKQELDAFWRQWFGGPGQGFRLAYKQFATDRDFAERLYEDLRKLLVERVAAGGPPADAGPPPIGGDPFRGLAAFEFEHADRFFGREAAVAKAERQLTVRAEAGTAFLLVLGMSGCGKSSFVRAGLLPRLTLPGRVEGVGLWRWCIFRPGGASGADGLFAAAAAALFGDDALPELALGTTRQELAEALREAPRHAVPQLRAALVRAAEADASRRGWGDPPPARLILFVDQLEELFTRETISLDDRRRFDAALEALARGGVAWVVAAMRSDFYHLLDETPSIAALKEGDGQLDLPLPTPDELGRIVRLPAVAAGLMYEFDAGSGRGLDQELCEAAGRHGASLPLLQFTLQRLYGDRRGDVLTFAAYRRLGGLEGALTGEAERILASVGGDADAADLARALDGLFESLVRIDPRGDDVAARQAPREELAAEPVQARLAEAMIKGRLLSTDRDPVSGAAVVTVAHEALLRHWDRARAWVSENRDLLRVRQRVEDAAARWRAEGERSDLLLPRGLPLAEAGELLRRRRTRLPSRVSAFIAASSDRDRMRRRSAAVIAAVVFSVISGLAVFSFVQMRRAEKGESIAKNEASSARAETRRAEALRLAAESGLAGTRYPERRLLFAVEAAKATAPDRVVLPAARQALYDALFESGGTVVSGAARVRAAATVSPDGRWLAAYDDGVVRLSDLSAAGGDLPVSELAFPVKKAEVVLWFPDGGPWLVALARVGNALVHRFWDLEAPDIAASVEQLPDAAEILKSEATIAVGGPWFARWTGAGAIRVRDLRATDIEASARDLRVPGEVRQVAFAPTASRMAAAVEARTCRLWDLRSDDVLASARDLPMSEEAGLLSFSPDGRRLGAANDGVPGVRLWDVTADDVAASAHDLPTQDSVERLVFSPSGRWLVAAGDGPDRLWDLEAADVAASGRDLTIADYHIDKETVGDLTTIEEGPAVVWEGSRLAFASEEGGIHLWELDAADDLQPDQFFEFPKSPVTGAIQRIEVDSPHGRIAAVMAEAMLAWDLGTSTPTRAIAVPELTAASFSADDGWLVTIDRPGSARLWPLSSKGGNPTPNDGRLVRGHEGPVLAAKFGDESRHLLTVGADGAVRRWPLGADTETAFPSVLTEQGSQQRVLPGGRWLATYVPNEGLRLRSLASAEAAANYTNLSFALRGSEEVVASPDGRWLLHPQRNLINALFTEEIPIRLWDLSAADVAGSERVLRDAPGGRAAAVAFSADGRRLAVEGDGDQVRVWDLPVRGDAPALDLPNLHTVNEDLTFSADGRWLADWEYDGGEIRLWEFGSADRPVGRDLRSVGKYLRELAFSPDSRRLVGTGDDAAYVRVWNLEASDVGRSARDLALPGLLAREVRFSPDSRWLIASHEFAGPIRLWDVRAADPASSARDLQSPGGYARVTAFSQDGGRLAASGDPGDPVRVWELNAQDVNGAARDLPCDHVEGELAIRFDPSGRWVAGRDEVGDVLWLWDLDEPPSSPAITLSTRGGIPGETSDRLELFAFASGRSRRPTLVVAGPPSVRFIPLDVTELIELATLTAGRPLSDRERRLVHPGLTDRP